MQDIDEPDVQIAIVNDVADEWRRTGAITTDLWRRTKRAHKEQRGAEAVVTAMEEVKVHPLGMMGKGKNKGCCQQHQKSRLVVLQRVRRAAELSPEQTGKWEYFTMCWDREMAEAHGDDWAERFAELVQHVLNDLGEGRSNELSVFMHNETKRVLA